MWFGLHQSQLGAWKKNQNVVYNVSTHKVPMFSNTEADVHNIQFFSLVSNLEIRYCKKNKKKTHTPSVLRSLLPSGVHKSLNCAYFTICRYYQCLLCIPVFPCKTSGDKSMLVWPLLVLPWGRICRLSVRMWGHTEESGKREKPLNTEINFCLRAATSPSTLFKQLSNFVHSASFPSSFRFFFFFEGFILWTVRGKIYLDNCVTLLRW